MRVLGFDPGTATTGYGVVDQTGSRLRHVAHGVISTPPDMPFQDRLAVIFRQVGELIQTHRPDAVAIEKLFFSQNVTTGIGVAQARGVIALAAALEHVPLGEFSPLEVKNATVGYGKATKKQVQEMVKILLNLDQVPRPDDAADALGIAICQTYAGARTANMIVPGRQSASRGSPAPKGSSRRKSGR